MGTEKTPTGVRGWSWERCKTEPDRLGRKQMTPGPSNFDGSNHRGYVRKEEKTCGELDQVKDGTLDDHMSTSTPGSG